ncbi:GspH/FimT family pseudopilin [Collimonas sp.]|uniref:GspH/FimT family pseudopilin n=1 Tax=Collimonas sp. TaxID=1963772 RepID=UPI002BA5FE90|nr:GspH/FimT family pseudopilin [Collimonas sp.]HWX01849.1 GspH/FimT family pseudopilin [Collimonas sp.]
MPLSLEERGFSLIELMVTITLAAIMMAVAIPSFSSWIQNTRIRSTAEALQNGIRLAKTEAVRRSRLVDFRLTAVTPPVKDAATSKSGSNWYVQQNDTFQLATDSSDANYNLFIQGSSLSGTNANVVIAGDVDTLTFTSLGRLNNSGAAPYKFEIKGASSGSRNLRVIVTQSGQIRMCDPQITLSSTTPTGC